MAIIIGQASIDERGGISGGQAGDQTGKEIAIREWYSYPWDTYLECTDKILAKKAATYMKQICDSNAFGYDQSNRWTGLQAIINNSKKVLGAKKSEFDCSSLVLSCYALAGLKIEGVSLTSPLSNYGYTGSLESVLMKTGKFKSYKSSEYVSGCSKAKTGGIYLNTQCHTCMVVSGIKNTPTQPKTYKLTKNTGLYKYAWADPVGKKSIPVLTLKKGIKVEWVKDDGTGWSQIKYKGKKYWIVNTHLNKSGLSKYRTYRVNANGCVYKVSNGKLGKFIKLAKAKKYTCICVIKKGKYEGYKYLSRLGVRYYAK